MKFSTVFSAAALACANFVHADSEEFGLITFATGTQYQYTEPHLDGQFFTFGERSANPAKVHITQEGTLVYDGKVVGIDEKGLLTIANRDNTPAAPFSIVNGFLRYKDGDFCASEGGANHFLVTPSAPSCKTGVMLRTIGNGGNPAKDFPAK